MTAQTSLRAWGNSQGVLIPKVIIEALHWALQDELEIETIGENELRVRRKFTHRTLEERIAEHGGKLGPYKAVDWGGPVGREVW